MFLAAAHSLINKCLLTGLTNIMAHPQFLDVWNNANKGVNTLQTNLTNFSKGVFIVAVILGAILLIGGNRLSESAKSLITKALIGAAIVAVASIAIPTVTNLFK